MNFEIEKVRFDGSGLVPVVVQDSQTKDVLMLGYASETTLQESISLGKVVFYSRSRNSRWLKGESSGNYLHLESLALDCDSDAILAKVHPEGPTCHTGSRSCFEANDA